MNKVTYVFFLVQSLLPQDFVYPKTYADFVDDFIPDLNPWHFFDTTLEYRNEWINKRYPQRQLVPFARRYDNDDVACFNGKDTSGDPDVIIIHDWASPGWENHGEFKNFTEWLAFAKEMSEEWRLMNGE